MRAILDRVRQFFFLNSFILLHCVLAASCFGQSVGALLGGEAVRNEMASGVDTWDCLPEETAFAMRIPNGKAFARQFIENTKLGSVILSEKRKELISQGLAKHGSENIDSFELDLKKFGLTWDDLLQLFAGETGYAVVVVEGDRGQSVPLGLAWMEPGQELADKSLEALAQAIDSEDDSEHPPTRIDVELAGTEVMQLTLPDISVEYSDEFEYPENYEDLPQDEKEQAWEEAYEKWENSATEKVNYGTALIATYQGRLLIGHSFAQSESEDTHPDGERLAGLFTRLLESHEENSSAGGFVEKYADSEEVARVMGIEGTACLELVGEAQALMQLAKQSAADEGFAARIDRVFGFESLGQFAIKSALDGNLWETQATISISEPREGVMQLVDQEAVDLDPPAWVPASAVSYSQISFDLGAAYALVKDVVTAEFPQQSQYFGLVEMQLFGFAQASLEDVLSSLGTRHALATFAVQVEESDDAMPQKPEVIALVWQLADEQIWKNIFKAASPWVKNLPGGEVSDEQGYNGFRFSNNNSKAGVFLGNGTLVLVVGPGMIEAVLSAVNDPPEGSDAYRESEVFQKGAGLLPSESGIGFSITDGNEYAVVLRDWMASMIENIETMREAMYAADEPEEDEELWALDLMKKLMPNDDEIENIMGVSATSYEVNDAGMQLFSIQELPPPGE